MHELTVAEIDDVSGGVDANLFFAGFAAAVIGTGLAAAGMGTPITIAGAVLAVEGAAAMSVALAM
ncbi:MULTISPECIES: hypothetical protein [unclassified Undibacterium]|nr:MULTISPECIES: hypothetical protein [unclassified Undibacterium]MEB0217474.1 hypothetical protein [Undibacterium sp. 5I2]